MLALDTSARHRLVALVVEADGHSGGAVAPALVDRDLPPLLAELDLMRLTAVVVVTGPGSYTGIRAGMAAGLGIAQSLALPLHGIGALRVVALGEQEGDSVVGAAAAAGRGGLHVAVFRRGGGGELEEIEAATRVDAASWTAPDGIRWVSADDPPPPGCTTVDPVAALAAAARVAVRCPPLSPASLAEVAHGGVAPGQLRSGGRTGRRAGS